MLKIKDDVDLKELERFGFKKEYSGFFKYIQEGEIAVQSDRSLIVNLHENCAFEYIDTIYNLIQAGLIEKVEEE